MKVFISGKMTGEPNYNREMFNEAHRHYTEKGHIVLNPAILPDGLEHEDYMNICFAMLDACDKIIMLPGWEKSKGATMERDYADKHGKEILEVLFI